ncbi:hypothetical protein RHMOL_Rhmol13G0169700 [Rhododendron molle]|uniref:Uncharacterized protein n=1 Tax=Rhododendron molle TaxID=49168 RepID=A0ACC0L8L4_RHOML|nr:hypothetical protein RHMOL_Rhmol13G0169700 [Rhododendron molle]
MRRAGKPVGWLVVVRANSPFGWRGEKGEEKGVFSINGEKGEERGVFSINGEKGEERGVISHCSTQTTVRNQTLSCEKLAPA